MASTEVLIEKKPSWLSSWWVPFLWITLTPLVTFPLSAALFAPLVREGSEVGLPERGDGWFSGYIYSEVAPTLLAFVLPEALNLLAFLWAVSSRPRMRPAAIIAGALGLLRIAVPLAVLLLGFERFTGADGGSYFRYSSWPLPDYVAIWFLGALVWSASLLVWAAFGLLTRDGEEAALATVVLVIGGLLFLGLGAWTMPVPAVGLPLVTIGLAAFCVAVLGARRRPAREPGRYS